MSRVDPAHDLTHEGVPGDPDQVPASGTASVESRLTATGRRTRGTTDDAGGEAEGVAERARSLLDDARGRVSELGERAGDLASQARDQLGGALGRAEQRLEEQSGVISLVREYPLVAAGLAFGAGFLLATETSHPRRGLMGTATRQLRSAFLGSATTLLVNELQDLLDEHGGPVNLLRSLTGGDTSDDGPR